MPRYKVTEVHPDYPAYLSDSPSKKERELLSTIIGRVVVSEDGFLEHDAASPLIGSGETSLDGWVGFPPWFSAYFEDDEDECLLIAVKVEELSD